MKKMVDIPKMNNPVDHLLLKICMTVSKARIPTPRSNSNLVKLDKYCSELDKLSCMGLVNSVIKAPFSINRLHYWTESLLRVCDLYDQKDDPSKRDYYYRLQRHMNTIWDVYMSVTNQLDQWNCIYMYVTMELFIFQIKWKKMGIEPSNIIHPIKIMLEMLKNGIVPTANLYLPHPYAKDLILPETYIHFE